jgi:tRNA modification GTPase
VTADTIAAIATPPGRGGIGVVRISGPLVRNIATELLGTQPAPRQAQLRKFRATDGSTLDNGLALYFAAPASFTGEDVLELHAHGGPVLLDLILSRVLQLGARLAQPGEFSQRAFLNDKLDLLQAEAIADLIDSGSQQAARAAMRSLQGDFSTRVNTLLRALTDARVHIEAAIDFPEEEIDFLADPQIANRLTQLSAALQTTLTAAEQGVVLSQGLTVVIAGRPNAGKSSLLNALAGYDAAIVTAVPGTTRDVLRERIAIDGMPLRIADTAGLRTSTDVVEIEGMARAHREMSRADRILYVIDSQHAPTDEQLRAELSELPKVAVTLVYNKIDLAGQAARIAPNPPAIFLSAQSGTGIDLLRKHLKECAGYHDVGADAFSARRRHLDALRRAQGHVLSAEQHTLRQHRAGELMAEELRQAQHCLGEITGEFTADDLLGRIFSEFCIGK